MELTLNLAWALIAIASYALFFRMLGRQGPGNQRGPGRWQCIVALTCALLILFPVISLTDDLHEMQATAEEAASCAVIKRCVASRGPYSERVVHQVPCLFAAITPHLAWAVVGAAAVLPAACPRPALQQPASGRAPPFLLVTFLIG
jgi:hypothetical protein